MPTTFSRFFSKIFKFVSFVLFLVLEHLPRPHRTNRRPTDFGDRVFFESQRNADHRLRADLWFNAFPKTIAPRITGFRIRSLCNSPVAWCRPGERARQSARLRSRDRYTDSFGRIGGRALVASVASDTASASTMDSFRSTSSNSSVSS